MELSEVKSIWQSFDTKLEKSMKLNLHCLEFIQTQKVKSQLNVIVWYRAIELAFHAFAIALLALFLVNNISQWPYAVSALALLGFYIVALSNCIKQIILIKRMDYSNDIVTIQSSLVMLRAHIVNFGRLAVLCIPIFLAFPMVVSKAVEDLGLSGLSFMDIRSGYPGDWWAIQLKCTIILIPLCVWFYWKVSYKNVHIKWINKTIQHFSSPRVTKSIEFLNELETLKHDAVV